MTESAEKLQKKINETEPNSFLRFLVSRKTEELWYRAYRDNTNDSYISEWLEWIYEDFCKSYNKESNITQKTNDYIDVLVYMESRENEYSAVKSYLEGK